MNYKAPSVALDEGLDLRKLVETGSTLNINVVYEDSDYLEESNTDEKNEIDFIGEPVKCFEELERSLVPIDSDGYVKKRLIEEGGGMPLHEGCTVSVSYSGYWENDTEPFDVRTMNKPSVVDLKDNGLLPGLVIAIRSMLVGEISVFLLTHHVMFGELGVPPRIKPKAKCVFYIKLIKSILTPKEGEIKFSEPNMFQRVQHEVKVLMGSGTTLYKSNNIMAAIQLFRKGVNMLHKCRLADEKEEEMQQKLLEKLYLNLAVSYTKTKNPLKACTACNELHRLGRLWNSSKALFHNAKALRMIGDYDSAEKKLKRSMQLSPNSDEINTEYELLQKMRNNCNRNKLINYKNRPSMSLISDEFKQELNNLIQNFKDDENLCLLTLPSGLNSAEMAYVQETCIRENLFCNQVKDKYFLDRNKGEHDKNEI